MAIEFPSSGLTPDVTTYSYGTATWIWNGSAWKLVSQPGYTGSAGSTGFTGSSGSLGYTGSAGAGYTGSASTVVGYTGSQGPAGGYTGSKGDTGYVGSGGSLNTRTTVSGTTSSLANNAAGNLSITGFKTYHLLKIQTSAAAWVTIYTDSTNRSSDSGRAQTTDPLPGSGVIAEVITSGSQTILITPSTLGFNNEDPVTTNIPIKVVNLSGGTTTITVTLTLLELEI